MRSPCIQCEIHLSGVCKKDHPKCNGCQAKWDYVDSLDPERLMIWSPANLYQGPRGSKNKNGENRKRDETYHEVREYILGLCSYDDWVKVRSGKKSHWSELRYRLIVKTKERFPNIINKVICRALKCSPATITKAMRET